MDAITIEKPAKVAKPAVVLSPAEADIKSKLDGLAALDKVKGLSDENRAGAKAPLLAALTQGLAEFGRPVARGNTLYTVVDGDLLVVDLTPGVLPRL